MSDIEQKLEMILTRLDQLEKSIVAAIPRSRRTKKLQAINSTPKELMDDRVALMFDKFTEFINMPTGKRNNANVPQYLMEKFGQPKFGGVTLSILANRTSMLKLFQPVFIYNEKSANEVARSVIRESSARGLFKLVQLCDSGIKTSDAESTTMLVLSHECWRRLENGEEKVVKPKKIERPAKWSPDWNKPKEEYPKWVPPAKKAYCEKCDMLTIECVCSLNKVKL